MTLARHLICAPIALALCYGAQAGLFHDPLQAGWAFLASFALVYALASVYLHSALGRSLAHPTVSVVVLAWVGAGVACIWLGPVAIAALGGLMGALGTVQ